MELGFGQIEIELGPLKVFRIDSRYILIARIDEIRILFFWDIRYLIEFDRNNLEGAIPELTATFHKE